MIRLAIAELRADPWIWLGPGIVACATAIFVHIDMTFAVLALGAEGQAWRELSDGVLTDDLGAVAMVAAFTAVPAVLVLGSTGTAVVDVLASRIARWRAAGARPGQTARAVVMQLAVVSIAGGAAGVLAATPVLRPGFDLLLRMLGGQPGDLLPRHTVAAVALTIALTLAICLVGALRPAVRAARVSPVRALRHTEPVEPGTGRPRIVLSAGTALCALAVAAPAMGGSDAVDLDAGLTAILTSGLLLVAAIAFGAPWALARFTGLWTAPMPARASVTWYLARSSVLAHPRRAGAQTLPFLVAVAVVGLFSGMISTWQHALDLAGAATVLNTVDTIVVLAPSIGLGLVGASVQVLMSARARTREYATIRCAGATRTTVLGAAVAESAQTAGTVLLLAGGVSAASAALTARVLDAGGLPVAPTVHLSLILVVAAVGWGCVAATTVVAALRAVSGNPRERLAED